jgi:hypothetical protein
VEAVDPPTRREAVERAVVEVAMVSPLILLAAEVVAEALHLVEVVEEALHSVMAVEMEAEAEADILEALHSVMAVEMEAETEADILEAEVDHLLPLLRPLPLPLPHRVTMKIRTQIRTHHGEKARSMPFTSKTSKMLQESMKGLKLSTQPSQKLSSNTVS